MGRCLVFARDTPPFDVPDVVNQYLHVLHTAVDNQGKGLVVGKTKGGAIFGGYNPEV